MGRYRKKLVAIDAFKWDGSTDKSTYPDWMCKAIEHGDAWVGIRSGEQHFTIWIRTLEGEHRAAPGDWIVQGAKGELYPCKPHIFAETYEEV